MQGPELGPEGRWFATRAEATAWILAHGGGRDLLVLTCHQARCRQSRTVLCDCEPSVSVELMTPEAMARSEPAVQSWRDRHKRN